MTDEPKHPLDYADDPASNKRRKVIRQLALIIVLKLIMVALNVGMAFGGVDPQLRLIGVGVQVGLTGVFLVLLFKLINLDRPTR